MVPYLFFLLIMGTIGNLFGLVVFRHGSMRKYSCSLYFFLMSIFDEITLIIWITNRLSELLGSGQYRKFSTFLCKFFIVGYYNSAQSSIGMLVLATINLFSWLWRAKLSYYKCTNNANLFINWSMYLCNYPLHIDDHWWYINSLFYSTNSSSS